MEHKNLGDILLEAGRVTQADVETALEYQRTHGGYFGQALVAQGLVRTEEVEWALASQFDLPLIFPDANTVDPEVAALVPAEWSLTNLAVPIVRAGDTLTVVVENPLDTDTVADLHQRTGLEIELALAPRARIRELVHELYGETTADQAVEGRLSLTLDEFIGLALEAGAERIGVSVRGRSATGWYTGAGGHWARVRRPLAPGWRDALDDAIEPSPVARATEPGQLSRWSATLRHRGGMMETDARALAGIGGVEYVFRPLEPLRRAESAPGSATIPAVIAADLRVLCGTSAKIAFMTDDPDSGGSILDRLRRRVTGGGPDAVRGDGPYPANGSSADADTGDAVPSHGRSTGASMGGSLGQSAGASGHGSILPRLPGLVWGDGIRAAHVALEAAPNGAFTLVPTSPSDTLFDAIEECGFDMLTIDLPEDYPVERVLGAAPVVLIRVSGDSRAARLEELGIAWVLEVKGSDRIGPEWELRSVRDGTDG